MILDIPFVDYLLSIIDKFGFPTALFVLSTIYFTKQLDNANKETNAYRKQTLDILLDQLNLSKQQLNITKQNGDKNARNI